jgi:hypothetical protein
MIFYTLVDKMFIFQNEKYPAYASTLLNIQPYTFNPKTTLLRIRGKFCMVL